MTLYHGVGKTSYYGHIRINGVAKHQDFKECFHAVSREKLDRDFELVHGLNRELDQIKNLYRI